MRITFEATVQGDPEELTALLGALGPEQEDPFPGAQIDLVPEGSTSARLTIQGQAPSSVRAGTNALLGWTLAVERVLDQVPQPTRRIQDGK